MRKLLVNPNLVWIRCEKPFPGFIKGKVYQAERIEKFGRYYLVATNEMGQKRLVNNGFFAAV